MKKQAPKLPISLNEHFKCLNFSTREINGLHSLGVHTVRSITKIGEQQLLQQRNISSKSVANIKMQLSLHGLKLAYQYRDVLDNDLLPLHEGCLRNINLCKAMLKERGHSRKCRYAAKELIVDGESRLIAMEKEIITRLINLPNCAFRPKKKIVVLKVRSTETWYMHNPVVFGPDVEGRIVRHLGSVRFETDGAKGSWWPEERIVLYSTATMNY